MNIIETERLALREMAADSDAEFTCRLLNSPKFLQYIGDRGVRTTEQAAVFIETRYRQSYIDHGFGLYAVELKADGASIGICGFVKRDTLPGPDLGFAFLPEFESKGYGYESASATLEYGRTQLGIERVLAITSLDNQASCRLLDKLGFKFDELIAGTGDEMLRLYSLNTTESTAV